MNKRIFSKITREFNNLEKSREELIKTSKQILKDSKRIIYNLHKNREFKMSNELKLNLKQIEKNKKKADKLVKKNHILKCSSFYKVAMQEYSEAILYYKFLKTGKIALKEQLKVEVDEYLGGLSDFTGELGRRAVFNTIKKNLKEVEKIREVIEEIYGLFLDLDLRNGELRRKSDSIKYNLKKVEELIYDVKIKNTRERN